MLKEVTFHKLRPVPRVLKIDHPAKKHVRFKMTQEEQDLLTKNTLYTKP
jgi:hypothetical protein